MKVRFAVLADYSNITQEGKPNIMGIFDIIHASEFPARHSEMQLVIRFEADISERGQQKELQVRLIDGRGEKILATIARHRNLAVGYVQKAIALIEALKTLQSVQEK